MQKNSLIIVVSTVIGGFVISFLTALFYEGGQPDNRSTPWDDIAFNEQPRVAEFDRQKAYARNAWGIAQPEQYFVANTTNTTEPQSNGQSSEQSKESTFSLVGIIREDSAYLALLAVDDQAVSAYAEGNEFGDYKITSIDSARVVITRKEKNETFTLFEQ